MVMLGYWVYYVISGTKDRDDWIKMDREERQLYGRGLGGGIPAEKSAGWHVLGCLAGIAAMLFIGWLSAQ